MASTDIQVYANPVPFSNRQIKREVFVGENIERIVALVLPNHADFIVKATIEGMEIPRENWRKVKPKAGKVVNITIVPQGGGRGILGAVLSIAVMIAAPYVGAALGASIGFGGLWVGSTFITSATIYGAAFSVIGKLAISALIKPPKQNNRLANNPAESPTQFIEGAKNQLTPFGVVPICLGKNRMIPPQAARPFTETVGDKQYIRQLFTWGYGESVILDNIRIGETPITQFDNIQIEHKLNGDLDQPTQLFSNAVFQEDFSVLLKQVDGFTQRSSQLNTNEVVIDLLFERGLHFFTDRGDRGSREVKLETQYAVAGSGVWKGTYGYELKSQTDLTAPAAEPIGGRGLSGLYAFRKSILVMNDKTNEISFIVSPISYRLDDAVRFGLSPPEPDFPIAPSGFIRLASLTVRSDRVGESSVSSTVTYLRDDRSSTLFGDMFQDSSSFIPSILGSTQVRVSAGYLRAPYLTVFRSTTEAFSVSQRIVFPAAGQYDVRIRRITADTVSDKVQDIVKLAALKSIRYVAPVSQEYVNGTAIRIMATDQLNGALDQLNADVISVCKVYNDDEDEWQYAATNNPAALYRYVLQAPFNTVAVTDAQVNLDALADWYLHCVERGYEYNRVIDYEASLQDILQDIAMSGSATPAIIDGKRTVVIDKVKENIVQVVTPRNSWNYQAELIYPELPHAFRVQFRNSEKGYQQDERIVYADGYNASNATKFETMDLQSCTNSDIAFRTGRRFMATALLRPETHSFNMAVENLVAIRGDRIKFYSDVPLIGVGDGRVKEVLTSGGFTTGIVIDDVITIPTVGDYSVRIRLNDGSQIYRQINVTGGDYSSVNFVTPFNDVTLNVGDLCAFSQTGVESDLIITRIEPMADLTARITALDYAPAIWDSEDSPIPAFNSNITTPLEFIRPEAPVLLQLQTNETVLERNVDGSFLTRAVFSLRNDNIGEVYPEIVFRETGTDEFRPANVLQSSPEYLSITGLQSGTRYDFHIRYKRVGGGVASLPLQINNTVFVGVSGIPADVTGFKIDVTGSSALLNWDANQEIDFSHYEIRYSGLFTGATWGTAQILKTNVLTNSAVTPFQGGTYLIKAVDLSGNYSQNEAVIITYDTTALPNQVADLIENPAWAGVKDNTLVTGNNLTLATSDVVGYYYFDNDLDLGGVYVSFVSASLLAGGDYINNLFTVDDIFALTDVFGQGGLDVFEIDDIFSIEDIFGIGQDAWDVQIEYRTTQIDPVSNDWTAWDNLVAGNYQFRAIQFRVKLQSFQTNVTPFMSALSVQIDMPDRIERGNDLPCPIGGLTITYNGAFKNDPAVGITIQNGAVDDRLEFVAKNSGGFTVKVYNATSASYVARTLDYIASGYGREE